MKSRIVPVGILGLMIAFMVAQAGNGFIGESTLPANDGYSVTTARDTVPENPQDTTKKKKRKKDKKKDKDTSNLPKPDTFATSFRP
ncbi:MAG: hypothetical protein ACTHLD_06950 [Chitinophaga sp.]|jgi:hypothetical protein